MGNHSIINATWVNMTYLNAEEIVGLAEEIANMSVNKTNYWDNLNTPSDISLNELSSTITGSKTFNMGGNVITWLFTNPITGMRFNWTAGASGHLTEFMEDSGGGVPVGSGNHLIHLEANDKDMLPFHIHHNNAAPVYGSMLVEGGFINFTDETVYAGNLIINNTLLYTDSVNGKVGIGRIPTTQRLELDNSLGIYRDSATPYFRLEQTGAGAQVWDFGAGSIFQIQDVTAGAIYPFSAEAGSVQPWGIYYDSTGFVGIGKATPNYKLDVEGDISSNNTIHSVNANITANISIGSLKIYTDESGNKIFTVEG